LEAEIEWSDCVRGLMTEQLFTQVASTAQPRPEFSDALSGTALVIQKLVEAESGTEVEVSSTRAGYIPGTHTVGFDSDTDQITLSHVARSREGFAHGAVFAAEWIAGRKGYFEFSAAIEDLVQRKVR